jgi:hypothetical protein
MFGRRTALLYQYHKTHWKGGRERVELCHLSDWLCGADGHLTRAGAPTYWRSQQTFTFVIIKNIAAVRLLLMLCTFEKTLLQIKILENSVRYVLWVGCHLSSTAYSNECIIYVDLNDTATKRSITQFKRHITLHHITYTAKTKCRKFETNIPRKGISGPQSQFPHSCVCELIIYSHDGSACSAGGNM